MLRAQLPTSVAARREPARRRRIQPDPYHLIHLPRVIHCHFRDAGSVSFYYCRLAAHHGQAADAADWTELFTTWLSLADWKVSIPFDAIDNCDIDAVARTGTGVRVDDCPDATTFRHLVVQMKRCHVDNVTLRVPPSITLQSLLYVTTVGQAEQREAPDVDDLRSAVNKLPGMQQAGRLALGSGCQTARG